MQDREKKLEQIARGCLGISLERGDYFDKEKLHQLPLVDLKQALQLAYNAGRDSVKDVGQ